HHLRPLGREHRGSDTQNNLICVCPNCHTKLDYGCVRIELSGMRVAPSHGLAQASVDYHNEVIFGKILVG
ncbi:MAG: HNH endonuclease, partial [Verrucomicrobium sp.]